MSDWIPISERLPEKNDVYLVAVNSFGCPTRDVDGFMAHTDRKWELYGNKVIAWMPLPEPYKAEIPTGTEGDKRIADKLYCTECPYFKYTNKDSDYWYGTKCEKDNHEAQPSMYAIQSLHNRCPLTEGSDKE